MILRMLKGLPASGKSTYAKNLVETNPDWRRTNKDDIRKSMPNYAFSRDWEKKVLDEENRQVRFYLRGGYNVVVDNTHLVDKHEDRLRQIAKESGADFEVMDHFMSVPLIDCVTRDRKRDKSERVGADRIFEMYTQYTGNQMYVADQDDNLPTAIITDVDGTLTMGPKPHRSPFEYDKVSIDRPNRMTIEVIRSLHALYGHKVIVVSGRSGVCRKDTEAWLDYYLSVPYVLHMRSEDRVSDRDSDIKLDIYNDHIKDKYYITHVFDDRYQVISEVWRPLGLPLLTIGNTTGKF